MFEKLNSADLEKYKDVKNIQTGQSFYDDYSVYSFMENGNSMLSSNNFGRTKSTNISQNRGDGNNKIDSQFRFMRNKELSEPFQNTEKKNQELPNNEPNNFPQSSELVNSSDRTKIILMSQSDANQKHPVNKYESLPLNVINEVNEAEFQSTKRDEDFLKNSVIKDQLTHGKGSEINFL